MLARLSAVIAILLLGLGLMACEPPPEEEFAADEPMEQEPLDEAPLEEQPAEDEPAK